ARLTRNEQPPNKVLIVDPGECWTRWLVSRQEGIVPQELRSTAHSGVMFDDATVARHYADGNWDSTTVAEHVRYHATYNPEGTAYRGPDAELTWARYDELATRLAGMFVQLG